MSTPEPPSTSSPTSATHKTVENNNVNKEKNTAENKDEDNGEDKGTENDEGNTGQHQSGNAGAIPFSELMNQLQQRNHEKRDH